MCSVEYSDYLLVRCRNCHRPLGFMYKSTVPQRVELLPLCLVCMQRDL